MDKEGKKKMWVGGETLFFYVTQNFFRKNAQESQNLFGKNVQESQNFGLLSQYNTLYSLTTIYLRRRTQAIP